ncbi:MAG: phytoene/squalene synthase family protein [Phaeospirillum sp.]|nr:phytoene/squalene synthase family protein [Phaeospirillum sp.]
MASMPDLSPAARLARDFDRERFITALFAPPERREALMLLYAFNVEVARVRESVHEPMAGMIRLQWWRDTIGAAHDGRPLDHHPIAGPLGELIRRHELPVGMFERLLAAREQDLEVGGPADLAAAETYAADTSSTLTALALAVLGEDGEEELAAGHHVGIAWALVGQVRALGFHLSIGRLTLPEAVLAEAGTTGELVLAGKAPRQALIQAAKAMAHCAKTHLGIARRIRVGRRALPALLPAVLADGHLKVLERAGWDPFDGRVSVPRPQPLRLAWANFRGKF